MNNSTFTPEEMDALKKVIHFAARNHGEDAIGVIMKSGAFRCLPDDNGKAVVELARKLTDNDHHTET